MREKLSEGTRKILKFAKEEAARLANTYIGSEHLLINAGEKLTLANKLTTIRDP